MEEQIFELILQARAEGMGAFAQVHADLQALGSELQQQTRLAEASYGQMTTASAGMAAAHKAHAEASVGAFTRLKDGLLDVGKVAAGFVAGGLITTGAMSIAEHLQEAADEVVTFGKQVITMQRIIGGSAEEASSFTAVFDRLGISSDTAAIRIAFFDKNLVNHVDAIEGGAVAHQAFVQTMQQLGVATTDAEGHFRSSRDVLLDTFDAISKLGSAQERTAAATNAFGRGGIQLMPAIMRGRAGFEDIAGGESTAGLTMNDAQLNSVKQFVEAQRDMGSAIRGTSTQLGLEFLPAATAAASVVAGLALAINEHLVPALHAIPDLIGHVTTVMNDNRLASGALAVALAVVLTPAIWGVVVAMATGLAEAAVAAGAVILPVLGIIVGLAAVAFTLGKTIEYLAHAWETGFGGMRTVVENVVGFITDKISDLLDFLGSNPALSKFFNVPADWRAQWGGAIDDLKNVVGGAKDAVGDKLGGLGDMAGGALDNVLHPKLTDIEPAPTDAGAGAAETNPFGLSAKQVSSLGTAGLGGLTDLAKMKEVIATAQDDLKSSEADISDLHADASARQLAFDQSQLANQQALLDLKKQGLAIDTQMLLPNEHLRDLQLDLKAAAQDQVRLADEQKLLALDAADFNQNADLKRIGLRISQAQEQLSFTTSPSEAGALTNAIDAMKRQQHEIRASMFGDDAARNEAEIAQSGDALGTKINQNGINQQIAAINALLDPIVRQKNAIDDATKAVQIQADSAKLSYDAQVLAAQPAILAAQAHEQAIQAVIRAQQVAYNQSVAQFVAQTAAGGNMTPAAVRDILKKVGLTDSEADRAADVVAQLQGMQTSHAPAGSDTLTNPRGGGNMPVVVNHYQVDLHNPVVADLQSQQQTLDFLQMGLEEAAAAGSPTPAVGVETH
jgi:hypothetical protein